MVSNIEKVLARGEDIDVLKIKSDRLREGLLSLKTELEKFALKRAGIYGKCVFVSEVSLV